MLLAACSGAVGDVTNQDNPSHPTTTGSGAGGNGSGTGSGGTGGGTGGASGGGTGGSANPATCQNGETHLPPRRVVLMSELQQVNAIRDLLGADAIPADPGLPSDRGRTLDLDAVNQVSVKSMDSHENLIETVGANVKTRAAALSKCTAGITDACAKQFGRSLAERAFRRPVTDDELTELIAAYTAGAAISPADGIATLTEAILFAPSAMYRRELGAAATGTSAPLNSYEVADALSYFLYASIPDDGLLAAAKADTLANDQGINQELDRLLATDRVKQSLSQTVLAWLQTARLAQVTKDPKYTDFGTLSGSMYTETSMFVDNFLWGQPTSVGELLTSTHTFVDPPLAKFYGVTYPGAATSKTFMAVDLPKDQRAGILTQAALLSIKAGPDNTSVIFRGLFVHDKVLCLPEISPPSDAATQAKIAEQEMGVQTEVEKATYRAKTSPCKGCHANFDPFGLTLESFDGIGRYRTKDDTGAPITVSVDLGQFEDDGLKGTVTSVPDLAQKLKESGRFNSCLTSQMMSYAANLVLPVDDCGVQGVGQTLTPGNDKFSDLVRGIVLSPTFRSRGINGAM